MSPLLPLVLALAPAAEPSASPKAIEQALTFLRTTQREDGNWTTRPIHEVGVTSLAGLAFLSAGHTPGRGKEGEALTKAIRAILKVQRNDGFFTPSKYSSWTMYEHGMAVFFLAEALGRADEELNRELRLAVEKGVAAIVKAQSKAGGWRYTPEPKDQDVSVTANQLLALKAAAAAGLTVPQEPIDRALQYVRSCHDEKEGGFRYHAYSRPERYSSCSAEAGLVLLLWAGPKDPGVEWTTSFLGRPSIPGRYPLFTCRFVAHFTVLLGGEKADAVRAEWLKALADLQRDDASWVGQRNEEVFGPAYATATAVLALTAHERRLRVFQPPKSKD